MISDLKSTFENFNKIYEKKFSESSQATKGRFDNFKRFESIGFPTKKIEDWKFSDFNSIIKKKFKNLNLNLENREYEFKNYIKDFEHNKIIFFNGFLKKYFFDFEDDKKVTSTTLRGQPTHQTEINSLNLLNNAFFIDGTLLKILKGYKFKKPVVIYNVFYGKKDNNFFNQKIEIDLEENTQLDLVINNINLNTEPIFLNTSNFFRIKKNGILKKFYINNLNNKDINYTSNQIDVSENGIFENFIMSNSGGFFKNDIKCNLNKNYSCGFINSSILVNNTQQHEIRTQVIHKGQNTKSSQKIKSVLDKNSKAIFQGKIYVDANAQKTDGYQLSKSILLDQDSEFDSKPELEIYADDVKCSHGSTSGSLDEQAIFYLMSRGLNHFEAKKLLIKAFLTDAIDTITNIEIKKYFLNLLERKINEFR